MKPEHIQRLGIQLKKGCVPPSELDRVLTEQQRETFSDFFGCQTACKDGLYWYDVEAVFERMYNNKLVGTQLLWD